MSLVDGGVRLELDGREHLLEQPAGIEVVELLVVPGRPQAEDVAAAPGLDEGDVAVPPDDAVRPIHDDRVGATTVLGGQEIALPLDERLAVEELRSGADEQVVLEADV